MNDCVRLTGLFEIWRRPVGAERADVYVRSPNLITTAGRDKLARLIGDDVTADPSVFVLGSGDTDPTPGDTALETKETDLTISNTTFPSEGVAVFSATLGASSGNSTTYREAGVKDVVTGGTLYARTVFNNALAKTADFTLFVQWTLQLT